MKYKAFISYRRSDSSERAQLVKLAIIEQGYEENDVFLDLHSIHEGEFPQHIKEALHDTEFFILLISKDSFNRNVEKDYYLDEIQLALDLKLRIIPVVFDSLNVDNLPIPKLLTEKKLKLKNSISYYPEYPKAFREKLAEFMKPNTRSLFGLIKMPALILTVYAILSLIGGCALWVYDNYFMSDEEQIETVSNNLQVCDGELLYALPEKTYVYHTSTQEIKCFEGHEVPLVNGLVSTAQVTQAGFWTVSVGLVYELSRTRLKPQGNGKSVLAYLAVGVSIVAGVGLGCTIERMIFPKQYALPIKEKLEQKDFWIQVVNKKFSSQNSILIE